MPPGREIAMLGISAYLFCMAKKKRRGRPKLTKATRRGSVVTLRLSPSERRALEEAREAGGFRTISESIRSALRLTPDPVKIEKPEAEGVGVEPQR